jgi:hypothetical protein
MHAHNPAQFDVAPAGGAERRADQLAGHGVELGAAACAERIESHLATWAGARGRQRAAREVSVSMRQL